MNNLLADLLVINASAGSGKTYQLVNRILALLERGVLPEKICATTFTKKAAAEISARLYRSLADAVLARKEVALSHERAMSLIIEMTRGGKAPKIATLDSFFSLAVKSFALELGLPPDWKVIDEAEQAELIETLCDDLILNGDNLKASALIRIVKNDRAERSIHKELVKEISRGLSHWRAGALVPDDRIKAWSWPHQNKACQNKASQNRESSNRKDLESLREAIRSAQIPMNKDGKSANLRFASAKAALLQKLEYRALREVIDGGLIQSLLDGKTSFSGVEIPEELRHALEDLIELIREEMHSDLCYKALATYELLSWFDDAYLRHIRSHGLLSYDDLKLVFNLGATSDWPELLALRLDAKFDHLLFDEFQDTSVQQWNFFQIFIDEILSGATTGKSLFVVGDNKQAIYGWRGGVKELFQKVSELVLQSGGNIISLSQSYRSSPAVINFVNQVFSNLHNTKIGKDYPVIASKWQEDFVTHKPAQTTLQGQIGVITVEPDERINRVIDTAVELLQSGEAEDIGILARTNKELRALAMAFDERGVNVSQEGGACLEDEPLCIALTNLLLLLDHQGDSEAALLLSLSVLGAELGFTDYADLDAINSLCDKLRGNIERVGLYSVISSITHPLRKKLSSRDRSVLDEILNVILCHEDQIGPRVSSIVRKIRKHKFEERRAERIRLLTAHSAKGLEFDVVLALELEGAMLRNQYSFLVHSPDPLSPPQRIVRYEKREVRALFPDLEALVVAEKAKNFDEALSVLYVLLTRAKRGIFLFLHPKPKTTSFQSLLQDVLQIDKPQQTLYGLDGLFLKLDGSIS